MGIRSMFSSDATKTVTEETNTSPNPNPYRFKIMDFEQIGGYVLLRVLYPDCTTHNGHKVLVYKHNTIDALIKKTCIDPHFLENISSPIARFPGTDAGWANAKGLFRCYCVNTQGEYI